MSNLWNLIKINISESLDKRKFKADKTKFMASSTFLLLIGALILVLVGWYSYTFYEQYSLLNLDCKYLFFALSSLGVMINLFSSIFQIKSIFVGKDYDLLRSMPIKKRDIILSKLISLYVIQVIYQFIIIVPSLVVGIAFFGLEYYLILVSLVGILFLPWVPMLLAGLIALFIALVIDRFRFRNIISIVFYIIFLGGIFAISFFAGMGNEANTLGGIEGMLYAIPTLLIYKEAMFNSLWYLLLLIGISLALAVIIIALFIKFYDKAHFIITAQRSGIKYVRKQMKKKGQFISLLKLEYKRFFSSKVYLINSISSGIGALITGIMVAIVFYVLKDDIGSDGEQLFEMLKSIVFMASLFFCFIIGITTPAAVSISMEGNTFWITKSLPISYRKLMLVKLFTSTSILLPFVLIPCIVITILFQPTLFAGIMLFAISCIYVLLASAVGLFINLLFPNFKWKNEQECAKRGMSVILSMVLDTAIFAGLLAIMINVLQIGINLSAWLSLGYVVLLTIIFTSLVFGLVNKRIKGFEEF